MFFFSIIYKKKIYLDNSSTNQKPKILFKSIINSLQKKNFNINRENNTFVLKSKYFFLKLKKNINNLIKSKFIEEIILFYNTTYIINFIILNIKNFLKKNNEILISNKEHNSILLPLLNFLKNKNIKIIIFQNYKNNININLYCNYFNNNTIICFINSSSNNFGYINKMFKISKICNYNNILFFLDVTQSISNININLKKIRVDFLFFSLHKLYSITGISVLYCNIYLINKISPFYSGGGCCYIKQYNFLFKKLDEKFYIGTQNINSIIPCYYSLKWFLSNKKFIFYINFYIKKNVFFLFKKKKKYFSNIILLNSNFLFNFYLELNKIIIRCDLLCNFLKKMFINKKKNCRISFNFYNKIKEFFKIKYLIFFFNFNVIDY